MKTNYEKISFYIYNLDLLSGSKSLKIFNREKNVSFIGLIFTCVLLIINIIYAIIKLLENYTEKNYSLISMEDNSQKINTLKYISNETFAFMRFYKKDTDKNGNKIEVTISDFSKIFKVSTYQYNFYRQTGKSEFKGGYSLKNCTNFFKDGYLLKYGSLSNTIEQSFCPPNNVGLKIGYNNDIQSILYFIVQLCNKTEDNNCYSKDEIKKKYDSGYLNRIYFEFYQENNIINNDNYTTPLRITLTKLLYYIDLNYVFKASCSGKFIKYESDNGIIFNDIKSYNGLRYNKQNYETNDNTEIFDENNELVEITYYIDDDYTLYYKRVYIKLSTIIIDIYGIARILFSIGSFIINYLSKNFFSFQLFNEIFLMKYFNKITFKKKSNTYNNFNTEFVSNKNLLNDNIIIKNDNDKNQEIKRSHISCLHIVKDTKEKEKNKKSNNVNNDLNKSNSDNSYRKVIGYDKLNKIDDEKYSKILFKYLGYDKKNKRKISLWNFICSQFIKINNETKIIDSCSKMFDKYLSLEQLINNGINIDILLSNFEYENNNIDIFDKIIDKNFKEIIKKVKDKMNN